MPLLRAYKNLLYRLYNKRVSATGLAAFRVAFTSVLLAEAVHLYYFRDIVYYLGDTNQVPKLIAWMIVLVFLGLGLLTRIAAVANYVLVLATISAFTQWSYHSDYTLIGVSFLLMFLPISRRFSLDSLILKLRHSSTRQDFEPDTAVPSIYYALPIFAAIALVYFDSTFWKLASPIWRSGLGIWTPASLPMTSTLDLTWLLDREWLVKGMSYLVIAFEATFILVMWFKKFRVPLLILGVGFHLGIALTFPIPLFGLAMASLYLLLVPHAWFRAIGKWLRRSDTRLTVFYDDQCPLCNRSKIIAKHFDLRAVVAFKGIAAHAAATPELSAIPREELLRSMYSVDHRGRVAEGIGTYRKICYYMGYSAPIAALLSVFPFRPIAKAAYAYAAGHRFREGSDEGCDAASCDITGSPAPLDPDDIRLLSTLGWKDLKIALIGAFMITLVLFQSLAIVLETPAGLSTWHRLGLDSTRDAIRERTGPYAKFAQVAWGLTNHSIYVDPMFEHQDHVARIIYLEPVAGRYTRVPLRITQEDGQAGMHAINRNEIWWNWRANDIERNMHRINHGILLYTRFWLRQQGITREHTRFLIQVKRVDPIGKWEKGFLRRQLEREWIDAGTAEWNDGKFTSYMPDLKTAWPSKDLPLSIPLDNESEDATPRPGHP